MGKERPWYPFYPNDWDADEVVVLLNNQGRGVYLRLLNHQWRNGSLPPNPDEISFISAEPPSVFRHLWKKLESKFPISESDGRRRNPRLEFELQKMIRISEARSQAAKAGHSSDKAATKSPQSSGTHTHTHSNSTVTGTNVPDVPSDTRTPQQEIWAHLARCSVDTTHIPDVMRNWLPGAIQMFGEPVVWATLEAVGQTLDNWNPSSMFNLKNEECRGRFAWHAAKLMKGPKRKRHD